MNHRTPERILVVGAGRSGTSLLQSMIASHPEVTSLPESGLLRGYILPRRISRLLRKKSPEQTSSILAADDRLARLPCDLHECLHRSLKSSADDPIDVRFYQSVIETVSAAKGTRFALDKDPRLVERLPQVWRDLPGTKVVHIRRDPRAVLNSRLRAKWSRSRGRLYNSVALTHQTTIGLIAIKCYPNLVIDLTYEKLLEDPESELRRVCSHVGLDYESQMLEFQRSAADLVSEREIAWKKETLGPLLVENANRWDEQLSLPNIRLIESICRAPFAGGQYSIYEPRRALRVSDKIRVGIASAAGRLACRALSLRRQMGRELGQR